MTKLELRENVEYYPLQEQIDTDKECPIVPVHDMGNVNI